MSNSVTTRGFGHGIFSITRRGFYDSEQVVGIVPGVEITVPDNRPHYKVEDNRPDYKVEDNRPHYKVEDNRPHYTVPDDRPHVQAKETG
jgi:hypothetical protein